MDNVKKISYLSFCFFLVFFFSACSFGGSGTTTSTSTSKKTGNFLKSFDGGKNWENKIKIDETKNIGTANVLSMSIDPNDGNIVYVGTETDGLFLTRNGGENWEKLVFPLTKIYGLAIDKNSGQTIYASGVFEKRAKIFKSLNGGKDWKEIYTEPANDSVISSLKISQKEPKVLYCGTSEGMIFKTTDGGQSWKNLTKASGPVIAISFDSANDDAVYFGISKGSVLRTLDGGEKIEDLGKLSINKLVQGGSVVFKTHSIEADPVNSGVLYIGTETGIFKGSDFGAKWEEINILESSKKFPVRAIAINPQNTKEIIYSNSGVIYHSTDNGTNWFTFQLDTANVVQVLKYDPLSTNNIYAGLRKI